MKKHLLSSYILFSAFISICSQPMLFPTLKLDSAVRFYEPEGADTIVMYLDIKNIRGGMANNAQLSLFASVPEVMVSKNEQEIGNIPPGGTKTGIFSLRFSFANDSNLRFYAKVTEHYKLYGDSISFKIYDLLKKQRAEQTEIMTNLYCTVGKEFTIKLRGNRTTLFTWVPTDNSWKDYLKLKSKDYIEDPNPNQMPGVGGTEEFTFSPKKSGTFIMYFKFCKNNAEPARIAAFNITVSE